MSKIVEELLPPDLPRVVRYRLVVSGCILGLIFINSLSWGVFSYLGLPGLARAADLDRHVASVTQRIGAIEDMMKDIRVGLLEQRVYDAQKQRCLTTTSDARRYYTGQIMAMHRQYYESTGISLQVPSCAELGS